MGMIDEAHIDTRDSATLLQSHEHYSASRAIQLSGELEALDKTQVASRILLMLDLGEELAKAKKSLPHGSFMKWCEEIFKKKPSWCSELRRLHDRRESLQPAREWAESQSHVWSECYSAKVLLALIEAWRQQSENLAPQKRRARVRPKEEIAELKRQLEEADDDFVALQDPLPEDVQARVCELVGLASIDGFPADAELSDLARRYHWRVRNLKAFGEEHSLCSRSTGALRAEAAVARVNTDNAYGTIPPIGGEEENVEVCCGPNALSGGSALINEAEVVCRLA